MSRPRTSDGKDIVLVAKFPGNVNPYFAGVGDSDTAIGAGGAFWFVDGDWDGNGDAAKTVNFKDWAYIGAGLVVYKNGDAGDHVSIKMQAPATDVTLGGASDVALVATGKGFNVITPSGSGTHELTTGGVFSPVPAYDSDGNPNGYWDWDEPDEGKGAMVANALEEGGYNLYDATIPLVRWVNCAPLIGAQVVPFIAETKGRKVLPHWQFVVEAHRGSASTLQLGWRFDAGRRVTI